MALSKHRQNILYRLPRVAICLSLLALLSAALPPSVTRPIVPKQSVNTQPGSATVKHTTNATLSLHKVDNHTCCGGQPDPTSTDDDGSYSVSVTWTSDAGAQWLVTAGGGASIAAHAKVTGSYKETDLSVYMGWGSCGQITSRTEKSASGSWDLSLPGFITSGLSGDLKAYSTTDYTHNIPGTGYSPPATGTTTHSEEGPGLCTYPPTHETKSWQGQGDLATTPFKEDDCYPYMNMFDANGRASGSCSSKGTDQYSQSTSTDTYEWNAQFQQQQCADSNTACPETHHYTLDLKSWIPQADLVDPFLPSAVNYPLTRDNLSEVLDPNCLVPSLQDEPFTIVESTFLGDSHKDYPGSFRVHAAISFDFDGVKITNFSSGSEGGTTVRQKTYSVEKPGSPPSVRTCTAKAPDSVEFSAEKTGSQNFTAGYKAGDPLIPLHGAPGLVQRVSVAIDSNGSVKINYHATDFPSAGIEVARDGTTILTALSNDASCLPPTAMHGALGAVRLFLGLNRSHDGTITADPKSPHSEAKDSPLC